MHVKDPPFAGPRWLPPGTPHEVVKVIPGGRPADPDRWSHVILSGSALSIEEDPEWLPEVADFLRATTARGAPTMGVCYGHQLLARVHLGKEHVRRSPRGVEVGWLPVEVVDDRHGWFADLPWPFRTWHFHFDEVHDLPPDWRVLARTDLCPVQAFEHRGLRLLGAQFHPEMDLDEGNAMFRAEREKIAGLGLDADALIADARDDGARRLFARFLEHDWEAGS
jgi:GMP synthase (glutamine-hydrolysing)